MGTAPSDWSLGSNELEEKTEDSIFLSNLLQSVETTDSKRIKTTKRRGSLLDTLSHWILSPRLPSPNSSNQRLCASPTWPSHLSSTSASSSDPLLPIHPSIESLRGQGASPHPSSPPPPSSSSLSKVLRCEPLPYRLTSIHPASNTLMCPQNGQLKSENGDENASAVNERLLDKSNRRRSDCGRCCLLLCSFLLFLSLITIIILLLTHIFILQPKVCTSMGCISSASLLHENMDQTIDPCQDFYKYACSRWINTTISRFPLGGQWHSIAEAGILSHQSLGSTINKIRIRELSIELSEGEGEVVRVFGECMDTDSLEKKGLNQWISLIQSIGGWRLSESVSFSDLSPPNLFEDLMLQAYRFATFPIFWMGVDVNYLNSREYIITIEEQVPILIYAPLYKTMDKELRAEDILAGRIESEMNILFQTGLQMATYAQIDSTDERVQESLARAMELEWNLVRISTVNEGKGKDHEKYNLTDLNALKRNVPSVDWEYFLERLIGRPLSRNQPIAIKAGSAWLSQLSMILEIYTQSNKGLKVLEDYIKWRILMVTMSYTMPRFQGQPNYGFELIRQFYVGQPSMREEFCLARLSGHFPLSTAALMRRLAPEEAEMNKKTLIDLFSSIQDSYREIIERSEILDESTREHVLMKLSNITFMASYPDEVHNVAALNAEAFHFRSPQIEGSEEKNDFFWQMVHASAKKYRRDLERLDRPVLKSQWLDNVNSVTLNALHNFERNVVVYPMSLTGKHFVDHSKPNFINFAGAAFFIGHEIGHAFDYQGRHYGTTGNLGTYWSSRSSKRYDENGKCFIDQYGQLKGGQETDMAHSKVTLYENLADNIGLQAAWKAFERSNDLRGQRLPGIELTSEQAFFVNYAQNWCSTMDPQGGIHEREMFRVFGPLVNIDGFSKAFQCKQGSKMNPQKRCFVF